MANFCTKCGNKLELNDTVCPNCGALIKDRVVKEEVVAEKVEDTKSEGNTYSNSNTNTTTNNTYNPQAKNKVVAGLLGIFLGGFGVHNFYLGYTGKAVAQLLITVLSCCMLSFVSSIWGFIEGILILSGNINKDAAGNDLVE